MYFYSRVYVTMAVTMALCNVVGSTSLHHRSRMILLYLTGSQRLCPQWLNLLMAQAVISNDINANCDLEM